MPYSTPLSRRFRLLAAAGLLAALLFAFAPSRAHAVSRSFFGLQAWSPPSAGNFKTIGRAKIGTFRAQINWGAVEPTPGARLWGATDALFARAAAANVTILPYPLGSPPFAASRPQYPPMAAGPRARWIAFIRDFVARYGHNGSFWKSHPGLPYRPPQGLQIWNEPNFSGYWNGHPNARQYANFVAQSRTAAKSQDSRIKIVLAGFPQTKLGILGTRYLTQFYKVGGAKNVFDVVAVHPYARDQRGELGAVTRARRIMRHYHDGRKQLWVTETGWATGGKVTHGTAKFKTSLRGQAKRLTKTYKLLLHFRRRYRIGMVVWFSFKDRAPYAGERNWWAINTGLFKRNGKAKPAWRAYKRITHGH